MIKSCLPSKLHRYRENSKVQGIPGTQGKKELKRGT